MKLRCPPAAALLLAASCSVPALAASPYGDDICVDSSWNALPGNCNYARLSADGMIIIMESGGGIYLRSRSSNITLSLGSGTFPSISADGKTAVWQKNSTQLGLYRLTSAGQVISTLTIPGAYSMVLSRANHLSLDGRFIAFSDIVAGDGRRMAYVYDRYLGTRTLASLNRNGVMPPTGQPNASVSDYVEISGDGQHLLWDTDGDAYSAATAIGRDVIRRNWRAASPVNTVVTSFPVGTAYTCGQAYHASSSASGQVLAFQSYNLCAGNSDTDSSTDIFVRDGSSASYPLLSVRSDGSHTTGAAELPVISADGRYVMFTGPDNLSPVAVQGAGNGAYLRDRVLNTTTRLSMGGYAYFTGTGWSWKEIGIAADTRGAAISPGSNYTLYRYVEGGVGRLRGNSLTRSYGASVSATFRCQNSSTLPGQNIYLIGSIAELGGWVRPLAVKLAPTGSSQVQTWQGSLTLPANTSFEWKCLRRHDGNEFWLNAGERKSGDSVDPLLWSSAGSGASGNVVSTTAASGKQVFSTSF